MNYLTYSIGTTHLWNLILFALHQFFPESRAGVELVTLGLAKELKDRGHEPFVLAAKRSGQGGLRPHETEDYEHEGIPVRRVGRPEEGPSRPFRLNYENGEMARRTSEDALEVEPDVVHAMHLQGLSASVVPAFEEASAGAFGEAAKLFHCGMDIGIAALPPLA